MHPLPTAVAATKDPTPRRHSGTEALAGLSAITRPGRTEKNRGRAQQRRERTAAAVARRFGFPDLSGYVLDRVTIGYSLAEISREAGLHKDWMRRQLPKLDPVLAAWARCPQPARRVRRWSEALGRTGFEELGTYLRQRYLREHRSVSFIAREAGLSRSAVQSGLDAYSIRRTATSRRPMEREPQ